MAIAEVYNGPPSSSLPTTSSPAHQMSSASTMPTTTPDRSTRGTFTPAQLEARTILIHLLTRLSLPNSDADTSQPHNQYPTWINSHTIPSLTESIYSIIRPQLWTLLSSRWSLDALKHLGGDLRYEGRAIYLNGILGLDKRLRVYVGQGNNLRVRVAQHLNFRYRRDHPSLHYYALEWSVYNVFGVLAVLPTAARGVPGMDNPTLLLNILEMWMCLLFRSLPEPTLREWLPDDALVDKGRRTAKEGVVGGLNVASPLDQGAEMKDRAFVDLSGEGDPIVGAYLREVRWKKDDGQEERKLKNVEVEVDEEERALRKKMYAERARRYKKRETDIVIPQWVFLGAVAVGVGIMLLRSGGGPQAKGRWR